MPVPTFKLQLCEDSRIDQYTGICTIPQMSPVLKQPGGQFLRAFIQSTASVGLLSLHLTSMTPYIASVFVY